MKSNPDPAPPSWEHILDRQLKALPDRPAPATLASRVMAAVHARARLPWYRRDFSQWPLPGQIAGLLALSLALAALTWAGLHFWQGDLATQAGGRVADFLRPLAAVASLLVALVEAAVLVLRQVPPLIWVAAAGVFLSAYVSALSLGTLLYRLATTPRKS
jgi:hypothetical protein